MKPTFITLLALCLCLGGCGKKSPGNPRYLESKSPQNKQKKTVTPLWVFKTGGFVESSPAIGKDGTIYFGSTDNYIYAVDGKTGTKKWSFETKSPIQSSPAIGSNGNVYIGSDMLYCLDGKTGAKIWESNNGNGASPAIGHDGRIYIASNGLTFALNGKTGEKIWESKISNEAFYSKHAVPAIATDGTVFVGSGILLALDRETGIKKWESKIARLGPTNVADYSPVVGFDGIILMGGENGKLYALKGNTGEQAWVFTIPEHPLLGSIHHITGSQVIGSDGTVYFGTSVPDSKVYALDGKSGKKLWENSSVGSIWSSPVISSDGTLFVENYALDSKTGIGKWMFVTKQGGSINMNSSPVLGPDGTLYISSLNNNVYAFETNCGGPAKSPWPMRGQNAQHTGRAPASKK
jgi:outer membrane protein assembly factor BamB